VDQIVEGLNEGRIPDEFSKDASVSHQKDNEWLITSEGQKFIIRKENGALNIYSGSTLSIWEWQMTIAFSFPKEGTWRIEKGSTVILRSGGAEYPFGEVRNGEIVDVFGGIWVKQE